MNNNKTNSKFLTEGHYDQASDEEEDLGIDEQDEKVTGLSS